MNSAAAGDAVVVDYDDVAAAVVCISEECVVAPSPRVVGGAVELRPAVAVGCDNAAAVETAVDQIFSPCCPHTP